MKKVLVLLVLAIMAFSFGNAQAQKIKLNIIGGYSMPMPDLKGTFPDDITKDPTPYMMKKGFNVGGVGKYFFDKKNSIGVTLSVLYNSFSQSVDNPYGSTNLEITNDKFKMNMWQIGLGGEYRLPLKGAITPFIDVDFTANFIGGDMTETNLYGGTTNYSYKRATRFGLNAGAGIEINASKEFTFVIGAKYQMFNLIGKDTTLTGLGNNQYGLNDKEYTIGGIKSSARNITAIQIYGGFSYNIDALFKK
ncbi:MAG: outer membrane beta-barrel protein [Ignavibacteria bacterium]|nr:outer membrane beta-barrel protein [Ignavibacteria bacterium]